MRLPECVWECIRRLENAGFACYAVGGCVRDALLGLEPKDYDLCTAALPSQTKEIFRDHSLVLAGEKHGTVGVITNGQVVEITTFRREGAYLDHRHPQQVQFVDAIEEDLARRDFTVNAMAWSPMRGFADPFGGREDLKNRILRAVGDPMTRFEEDALRILRGVRFAMTYGLTPEPETEKAMQAQMPLMDKLARERVFEELNKLLPHATAKTLLRFAPILTWVLPELAATVGFEQCSPYHLYDVYTHTAQVTEAVPTDPVLRWAAILHDVGKVPTFTLDEQGRGHFYGHGEKSAEMADQALLRLKAPTQLRLQVGKLIKLHMTDWEPDKKFLRRRLSRLGPEMTDKLLTLQEADQVGKGLPVQRELFVQIRKLLEQIRQEESCLSVKALAINGNDLKALGLSGPEIGRMLNTLLEQVMEEKLPNDRQRLLQAVEEQRK